MKPVSGCVVEEGASLCTCTEEVLGVRQEATRNHVLITVAHTALHTYDVSERRIVNSRALGVQQTLTYPIVQHPISKHLYAVEGGKTLRGWTADSQKLEEGVSVQCRLAVAALHVHRDLPGVFVLFNEGSAVVATEALDISNIQDRPLSLRGNKHPVVRYSTLTKTGKKEVCACAIVETREGPGLGYSLHVYTMDTQQHTETKSHMPLVVCRASYALDLADGLACATLDPTSFTLVTVGLSGTISAFGVPKPSGAADKGDTMPKLQPRVVRNVGLYNWERSSKQQMPWVTAYAFDGNYVAVLGEDTQGSYTLSIWDTIYGVVHTHRPIRKLEARAGSKGHGGTCQLLMTGGEGTDLVTVCGRTVDVLPVFCTPLTLASSLGLMQNTRGVLQSANANALTTAPGAGLLDPSTVENLNTVSKWNNAIAATNEEAQNVLAQLVDQSKTPTHEAFSATFYAFYGKDTQATGKKKKSAKADGQKEKARTLSLPFVAAVVQRCLDEKKFWAEDVLTTLLRTAQVSASSNPSLFEVLMTGNHLALLELSLLHVTDQSEGTFVSLLQYFMSPANQKALDAHVTATGGDGRGVDHFLGVALSSVAGDVFLQSALTQLTTAEIMTLLQYLNVWLAQYCKKGDINPSGAPHPTLAQVADWLAVLLDSAVGRLLLQGDAHGLLVDLKDTLQSHIALADKLLDLKGYLQCFKQKSRAVPKMSAIPAYSIEVIQF
eukprot:comp23186_c0_seq1/m.37597 comp23186_c0_seq1/g.37597  ORF comp23186_c0_seq1/g.37597 comp23186_c0_seq1/m.37597 type:complete len:721 (-) comp23186_c0_seq1:293-2455(-)